MLEKPTTDSESPFYGDLKYGFGFAGSSSAIFPVQNVLKFIDQMF